MNKNFKLLLKFIFLILVLILFNFRINIFLYFLFLFIFILLFNNKNISNTNFINKYLNFKFDKLNLLIPKIFIIFIFLFLGEFFFEKKLKFLGYISYLGAYIQTFFLFKIIPIKSNNNIEKIENVKNNEDKLTIKKIIQIFLLVFLLILNILNLYFLQTENYKLFIIFFILVFSFFYFFKFNYFEQYDDCKINKIRILEYIFLLILFLSSFYVRIYKLMDIPPGIFPDDLFSLNYYSQAIKTELPLYLDTTSSISIFITIYSQIFKFIKITIYNTKLVNCIISSIGIIIFYLFVKKIYNIKVAIFSSIIFSFMFVNILFSRKIELLYFIFFLPILCFYFYFLGLETKKRLFFIFAGIILTLTITIYKAGYSISLLFILWWFFIFIFIRDYEKYIKFNFVNLILVVSALISFYPILNFIIKFSNIYFSRFREYNLLWAILKDPDFYIPYQLKIYFQHFFSESCPAGYHNIPGHPIFDPITNYFFIFGIIYLLINIKNYKYNFLVFWFISAMLPGLLSGSADLYPVRIITVYSVYPIIAGIGIERIFSFLSSIKKLKLLSFLFIPLLLLSIIIINIYNFFYIYSKDPLPRFSYRYEFFKIKDFLKNKKNYKIFASNYYDTQVTLNQLDWILDLYKKEKKIYNLGLNELNKIYNYDNNNIILLGEGIYNKGLKYYINYFSNSVKYIDWNLDYYVFGIYGKRVNKYNFGWKDPEKPLNYVRTRWDANKYKNRSPDINFVCLEIPYNDIINLYTLSLNFLDKKKNERFIEKLNKNNIFLYDYYQNIEIGSLIEIPEYGFYEFKATYENAEFYVDDKVLKKPQILYKGLHKLKVKIKKGENKVLQILWRKGQGNYEIIPINYFVNSDKIYGLMAYYKNDKGEILYQALEPIMQFNNYFYHPRPGILNCPDRRCNITWEGLLEIEKEGNYEIYLETDRPSEVKVNNILVSKKAENAKPELKPIFLKKGKHKIEINSIASQIETSTRLLWRRIEQNIFYPIEPDYLKPF